MAFQNILHYLNFLSFWDDIKIPQWWHAVSDDDAINPWWCWLSVDHWILKQRIERDYASRQTAAIFGSVAGPAFQQSSQLGLLTAIISCWNKWRSVEGNGALTWVPSHPSQPVVSSSVLIAGQVNLWEGLGQRLGRIKEGISSTQPRGSHHLCWVQTFECDCFQVGMPLPVIPLPLLCK